MEAEHDNTIFYAACWQRFYQPNDTREYPLTLALPSPFCGLIHHYSRSTHSPHTSSKLKLLYPTELRDMASPDRLGRISPKMGLDRWLQNRSAVSADFRFPCNRPTHLRRIVRVGCSQDLPMRLWTGDAAERASCAYLGSMAGEWSSSRWEQWRWQRRNHLSRVSYETGSSSAHRSKRAAVGCDDATLVASLPDGDLAADQQVLNRLVSVIFRGERESERNLPRPSR